MEFNLTQNYYDNNSISRYRAKRNSSLPLEFYNNDIPSQRYGKFNAISNVYNNTLISNPSISINNDNKKESSSDITKLNFRVIESTTEDMEHPLRELIRGLKGVGWQSSRFSQFPQEIYIQFSQPVLIKRIDIIIHEKNIPSQIKFYAYYPKKEDEIIQNYHKVHYDYIGFIKMDTNERSNYRARESRKVYINTKAVFLKLQLEKNYLNRHNIFNQVGLMNIDFSGEYLPYIGGKSRNNQLILNNCVKKDFAGDSSLEDICGDKLNELKNLMEYNIRNENYTECKQLKDKIEKVRLYGKKIYDLEQQKKIAVNNEDFDKAMELKDLADKMKINLRRIDTTTNNSVVINQGSSNVLDIENQIIGNNLSTIGLASMNNNNVINDSMIINESITTINNDNLINQLNQSSIKNKNITNSDPTPVKNKNIENLVPFDDVVLPAVRKRLNNEPEKKEEEFGDVDKGILEEISPKLLKDFNLICNVIGEEGLRKVFSKQILWKDEGLNILTSQIKEILDNKQNNDINMIITQIMKLSLILTEEKHPSVVIKTLEILKQLFEYIREHGTQLDIDLNTTDSVLSQIKKKLGDVNPKVRAKAVSLYCFMLSLDFCDYNNLIAELLEEELRHYDSKYVPKSNNLIMGKLDIFISVFNNFSDAVNSKRTSKERFPSNLVIDYLIMNVSHNKSEIRKKTRLVISQFIRIFGVKNIKKKLEKIEERELMKLVAEIPELREYFPKLYVPGKGDLSNSGLNISGSGDERKMNKNKSAIENNKLYNYANNNQNDKKKTNNNNQKNNKRKKTIEDTSFNNDEINTLENNDDNKDNDDLNAINSSGKKKNIININGDYCEFCKRKMNEGEILANHWASNCLMFTICLKCNKNVEVEKLNEHKEKECKFKDQFKLCKTCKECININDYEDHLKEKCSLKKGCVKCPLCHKDINITNNKDAFFTHLIKEGCPSQRKII